MWVERSSTHIDASRFQSCCGLPADATGSACALSAAPEAFNVSTLIAIASISGVSEGCGRAWGQYWIPAYRDARQSLGNLEALHGHRGGQAVLWNGPVVVPE